jgi:hypothetical protein
LPTVEAYVAIEAPRVLVERLVLDQAQRARFLPDGWSFVDALTDETDRIGSQMVIEWRLGPAPLRQVIELLELEAGDVTRIVEGPPGGDNYVTTWRIGSDGPETLVSATFDFDYGDLLGNLLVRRRMRKALTQMLVHLGKVAVEERNL